MKCMKLFISIIFSSLIFFSLYSKNYNKNQNGKLYIAVVQSNYKETKRLLEGGANPNARFNGLLLRELTQNEDIKQLLSLYNQASKNGIGTHENKKSSGAGNL